MKFIVVWDHFPKSWMNVPGLKTGFWLVGICWFLLNSWRKNMGNDHHYNHHHHHHHHGDSPYDDPFLRCCCCPCFMVSSIFTGIRRCIFVACYPLLRCFGLDDSSHHHHRHHSHFHWTHLRFSIQFLSFHYSMLSLSLSLSHNCKICIWFVNSVYNFSSMQYCLLHNRQAQDSLLCSIFNELFVDKKFCLC